MKRFALMVLVAIAAIACKKEEPVVPEIKVTTTEFTLPLAGTEDMSYKVEFNANVAWTAALKEAADWCTITPSSGAAGDAAVTVIALENKLEQERVATLVITAGSAVEEVVLTQEALFVPRIEAEDLVIPTAGGKAELAVNATVPFTVAYEAEWLTYEASANKVVFTATENTDPDPRAVLVTLANAEYELETVVEVSQDGICKLLWAVNMADVMNRPAQAPMFSTDNMPTAVSIALYDGNVVLSAGDGSEPVKLNKATGEKVGTIATGGFKPYTVRQDDAGNLVMSNRVWAKWTNIANSFALAYLAPNSTSVVKLIDTGDNDPDGALREEYLGMSMNVRGDVTSEAIIALPHNNGEFVNNVISLFDVTNGSVTKTNLPMVGHKGVNWGEWAEGYFGASMHNQPGLGLLGNSLTDGAIVCSYDYNLLQHLDLTSGACTVLSDTPLAGEYAGNFAPTGVDIRTINGKQYMAVALACFYATTPPTVYLFDVESRQVLHTWDDVELFNPQDAGTTNYEYMYASVTLEAAEGGAIVYLADKSSGTIAAKFFTL